MEDFGFIADEEDVVEVGGDFGFIADDTRIDMDAPQPREMAPWESAVQGFRDMTTFGFGNELTAGVGAGWEKLTGDERPIGQIYDEELATAEGANVQAQAQNPNAYTTGEVAGFGAQMALPGAGALGKGAKAVVDAPVKMASRLAEKGAEKAAGTRLGKAVVEKVGGKVKPQVKEAMDAKMILGEDAAQLGVQSAVRSVTPQTVTEAVGAVIGHGVLPVAGVPIGVQAVRQTGKKIIGTKGLMGRQGNAFAQKYGDWLVDVGQRGTGALTANVFVRQQQDPEFKAALKAAKEEAAKNSE